MYPTANTTPTVPTMADVISHFPALTEKQVYDLVLSEMFRFDKVRGITDPLYGWGIYKRLSRSGANVALSRRQRLVLWRYITATPAPA